MKKTKLDTEALSIDRENLDEEWIDQPLRYFQYAEQLAQARLDADVAKDTLEVVKAELDQSIRADPSEYDLEKTTEGAISNCITLQDEYQHALGELRRAKHTADVLGAMVQALDHRKRALESLVYLHGQAYFGEPTVQRRATRKAKK